MVKFLEKLNLFINDLFPTTYCLFISFQKLNTQFLHQDMEYTIFKTHYTFLILKFNVNQTIVTFICLLFIGYNEKMRRGQFLNLILVIN